MQYNQNLRCDMPMSQPAAFNQGQPPFTPQLNQVPQQFQQYVPYIAAELATQVGQNVVQNPHAGRIYLFNQLSASNFANTDYVAACQLAMDIYMLNTLKRVYTDAATGVRDSVQKTLGILGSMNIAAFPMLQSRLDPAIVNEARLAVGMLAGLNQEIQQMRYSGAQQPDQMMTGMGGFGGAVGTPLGNTLNASGPLGGAINNAFSTGGSSGQPIANTQPAFGQTDRNAYLRNNSQATQPQITNNNNNQTHQQVQQPPAPPPPPKTWLPSQIQAYPPTYVVGKHTATLVASYDPITSQPCAIFEVKEETEMDRTKHQLTHAVQAFISAPVENGKTREQSAQAAIEKVTKKMSEMINDVAKEPIAKIIHGVSDTVIHATSVHNAIFDARYRAAHINKGQTVCTSLISPVLLTTPFVTNIDHRALIKGITECAKFKDVSTYLTAQAKSNTYSDAGVREFFMNIDAWLTNEFNNVISKRLCLDAYSIDSFVDDADDFFGFIRNKRGDIYADALLRVEELLIKSWVAVLDEADHDILAKAVAPVINIEDNEVPQYLTMIPNYITVTVIGVHSKELKIGIPTKGSAAIDSTNFPFLHRFVSTLYSKIRDVNVKFNHHYLVTSDDVVYEVTEGLVGYGAYLIACA